MYTSIGELPTQVRMALDDEDSEKWMEAYNKADPHTDEEVLKARKKAWKACKDLPSSFSFSAIASVEDVDKDGEVIGVESIVKHADDYLRAGGNLQDNHGNYNVGTCWDIEPCEIEGKPAVRMWGNIFGGDEVYDAARKAFIKGFNNVSIAGEADTGRYSCDFKGCYVKRNVKQLLEISLCRVPSNRHAKMTWCNENARLKKSSGDVVLGVDSYELHRDYSTCPVLGLRKALRDKGIEAHARPDHVEVPGLSEEMFRKTVPLMKSIGAVGEWRNGTAWLYPREQVVEREFRKAFDAGRITPEGRILSMDREDFDRMYNAGLLEREADGWHLSDI